MTVRFSEYQDEINKVKKAIVAIEKEVDAFSFMSEPHRNDINDLLERAWGLLEVHRETYEQMRELQEQAIVNKEAVWRMMRHD